MLCFVIAVYSQESGSITEQCPFHLLSYDRQSLVGIALVGKTCARDIRTLK